MSSSDVRGGAVLLVLGFHSRRAHVFVVVVSLRFLEVVTERGGIVPVVECGNLSISPAGVSFQGGGIAVPGSFGKHLHISDVSEAVFSTDLGGVGSTSSLNHSGASSGRGNVVFKSVSQGTGGDVDGEVLANLIKRRVNSLDHHVSVSLVGVVVTLLESVREDTGSLGLGETEGSLDGAPFVGLVQVLELEIVVRGQ